MLAVDSNGKLFDERRKDARRKEEEEVESERRVEDRRKDEWVKNLENDENQKD